MWQSPSLNHQTSGNVEMLGVSTASPFWLYAQWPDVSWEPARWKVIYWSISPLSLGFVEDFLHDRETLGLEMQEGGGSLWKSQGVDSLCHHPVRKPPLSFCGHISEQFPSLTALPLPPPEKQNFEKFQVKTQPSNSTVGYSKEKKNKNQCRPSLRFWGSSRILFVTWKDQ